MSQENIDLDNIRLPEWKSIYKCKGTEYPQKELDYI